MGCINSLSGNTQTATWPPAFVHKTCAQLSVLQCCWKSIHWLHHFPFTKIATSLLVVHRHRKSSHWLRYFPPLAAHDVAYILRSIVGCAILLGEQSLAALLCFSGNTHCGLWLMFTKSAMSPLVVQPRRKSSHWLRYSPPLALHNVPYGSRYNTMGLTISVHNIWHLTVGCAMLQEE